MSIRKVEIVVCFVHWIVTMHRSSAFSEQRLAHEKGVDGGNKAEIKVISSYYQVPMKLVCNIFKMWPL